MRKTIMKFLKGLIPLALLAVGVLGLGVMVATKPKQQTKAPEIRLPLVETLTVEKKDTRLTVSSQGTVTPHTSGMLVSEVAGKVIEVNPFFVSGRFFSKGDTLLRINPRDYKFAVTRAKAQVAAAESHLIRERASATVAENDWGRLGKGEAPPLALHKPQLKEAEAALEAAKANLQAAELNLERTVIKAPYDGCIREKRISIGQFITPGTPLAWIYATDFAEVRLPLSSRKLAQMDYSAFYGKDLKAFPSIPVKLKTHVAGKEQTWQGWVDRIEGHIDGRSRMSYAVVRIKDPYGRNRYSSSPSFPVGLFVKAEIEGRRIRDAVILPRIAMRDSKHLLTVDGEDRLRFHQVSIIQADRYEVIINGSLDNGERVCVTALDIATEGMKVRVLESGNPEIAFERNRKAK